MTVHVHVILECVSLFVHSCIVIFSPLCVCVFRVAVTPPGQAREDWKIIRALSEVCTTSHTKPAIIVVDTCNLIT